MDRCAISLLRIIERNPLAAACALNPHLTEQEIAQEIGVEILERKQAGKD